MRRFATIALTALASAVAFPTMAAAPPRPPVRIEILSRTPAFASHNFGETGTYETIRAVAHLRVDPAAPANRRIADLARAPRAADGMVDCDVDLVILRPADPAHARPVLLYDVVNRGMKLLGMLNQGGMGLGDPIEPGDGLLMRQGLTMVWSGWQGDLAAAPAMPVALPPGMHLPSPVAARFPVVAGLTGRISAETIFDNATGNRMTLAWPAATLAPGQAVLTVRARTADRPRPIPASQWHYQDATHVVIDRPAGFDAGAIYRFDYTARDPRVMGLGFAATRDLVSFLRHATAAQGNPLADFAAAPCDRDAQGHCNPRSGAFSSAVAIGGSQSGRYLRDFLWQGFNRDLGGRRVFDGMIPYIAGARRTFTNFRFAEPGRFSRQHEDHDVPGFGFPFTYATLTDPVTGRRDGLLAACTATRTCPRLFHVDTSAEFWQAGAALVGTGGTTHDVPFPANVRAYMITGGPHAPGLAAPACALPANPLNYAPALRALLVAMLDWTGNRAAPPPSVWPSLASGDLVALSRLAPPRIPGVDWPTVANRPTSPVKGRHWPLLVPAVDADGIDRAGIRLPEVAAPDGTYLGWNPRKSGYAAGDLCLIFGAKVPFPASATPADSRRPLGDRPARAAIRQAAADHLVKARLLLPEDARPPAS